MAQKDATAVLGAESGAPVETPPARSFSSQKELNEWIRKEASPEEINQVLKDLEEAERLKKTGASPESSDTPPPKQDDGQPPQPGADDQEVVVRIKPSQLGTYGKNRGVEEAVQELVKGHEHKDRLIDTLKERQAALEAERQAALDEAEELREKLAQGQPPAPPAPAAGSDAAPTTGAPAPAGTPAVAAAAEIAAEIPKEPEEPEMPDPLVGDDVYDEAKQTAHTELLKKYKEDLKQFRKDNAAYQRAIVKAEVEASVKGVLPELKQITGEVGELKTALATSREASEAQRLRDSVDAQTRREFDEVESMRKQHQAVFGVPARSTQEIESDWIQFVGNMAYVQGVKGELRDANGVWKPEVATLINTYANEQSPEGKTLKEKLDAKGVIPPADRDSLFRVYTVRTIRNKYGVRDDNGNFVPLPYEEALQIAALKDDRFNERGKKDRAIDEVERRQRAEENRGKFVKEPSASAGAAALDINALPRGAVDQIWAKKSTDWTDHDKEFLRAFARSKDMKPEELHHSLKE
jgi:hypothetical protein